MFNIRLSILSFTYLFVSQFAHANIEVTFFESAPKDKFVLTNTGQCMLKDLTVNIDLSNSVGKLIFDTTATGAGVEVFQPFQITRGNLKLTSTDVKDGDSLLSLSITTLNAKDHVSFTIDVDDTLVRSELGNIRVSGSEITNANIQITTENKQISAASFNNKGEALALLPPC
ncbi:aggregation factor core [Psychromonas algicola]|uniref:aggregation factor core n=1 Tax=Psychromonas algicola TaxID=2555642 RepID=UPI0010673C07|nr:aggregation factor core [Psychromonas sp. RZ5]TEW52225.1 aggregation factor core [Psychromonas sp. RZ5]